MRTAWLVPLLLLSFPLACSDDGDDDGGDDNAAGRGGSNAGGSAGRGGAGASGAAGRGGAADGGTGGSSGSAGAAGSSGAAGAAGSGGAAGAAGSGGSSSGATGCEGLCARPLVCPGGTRAECLSSCEDAIELCPEESEALLECGESLSDDDFQCVGDATLPDDDLCVMESAALARCRIGF